MADDKTTLRVLGIAGCLGAGSFNRALLRAAQELAPEGMEIRAVDIAPIPATRGFVRKLLAALRDWTLRLRRAPP